MENRQKQILSEIKEMMSSIREQLGQLDAKMAELQYEVDPQSFIDEPIDIALDDMPVVESVPAVKQTAVIDVMTARQQWRKDMPGAPVRDVRSAISLNDRVLFINHLFDEDPAAFQETLTVINQMSSLDEVVEHLMSAHPSWDMDSDLVYRFMMAIRRKVN